MIRSTITWVAPRRDGIPTPAENEVGTAPRRCRPTVTSLRSSIITTALVLVACGERTQAPPEAPAPAAAAAPAPAPREATVSPRFDGAYRTEPFEWAGSTKVHWIRFYPDGRVVEALTEPSAEPEQVGTWFDWGHPDARQRGRFELAERHVRIETRSPAAYVVSMGQFEGDGFTLQWRDRTNDQRDTRRFRFAPIAAWAAAPE